MIDFEPVMGWVAAGVLLLIVLYLFVKNREWRIRFDQRVREELEEIEEGIRRDAAERSGRALSGKALEKMVPFLKNFGHDPHDVRWIGDPVDLVIFDGYSASGKKSVDAVTFVEVKSGESNISTGQKGVRDAIREKKVKWEEFRV
jgi:predicted Holliday junction resolvase-like endonuclease